MFNNIVLQIKNILAVLAICLGLLFVFSFCSYASDDSSVEPASPLVEVSQADESKSQELQDNTAQDNTPSNDDNSPGENIDPGTTNESSPVTDNVNEGSSNSSDTKIDAPQKITPSVTTGWQERDGYKYYYKSDGSYYKNTFAVIDGKTYHFDILGHLLYGANKYTNGSYYYSNKDGEVITYAGWVTDESGDKHYVLRGGKLYANTRVAIGKSTYFYGFDSISNLIQSAVYKYKGSWYYAGSNGVNQYYAKFVNIDDKTYYVTKGGRLYSGTRVKIGGGNNYYGFNQNAEMFRLTVYSYGGNRYYAGSSGINQYYAKFVSLGDKTYYVKNGGALYVSTRVKIGSGNNYYGFNSLGELFKSTVYSFRGKYYYAGSSGINQYYAKAVTCNGKLYYCTKGGVLSTNMFVTSNGKTFYVGSNGAALTGWIIKNGYAYYAASDGYIDKKKFGRFTYSNGKEYFSLPGGALYRNTYILIPEGYCYVDKNCVINTKQTLPCPFDENLMDSFKDVTVDYAVIVPSNRGPEYAWTWSYNALSLIQMWEATGNTKYLDDFKAQAELVLASRDNKLGIPSFAGSDVSLPLWSDNGKYSSDRYSYIVHTGMILLPMLMFADDVLSDESLHDKYLFFANEIIQASIDAFEAHERTNVKWYSTSENSGYYWIKEFGSSSLFAENKDYVTNMSQIYASAVGLCGKLSNNSIYTKRAEDSIRFFKDSILKYAPERDSYYWSYYPLTNPSHLDDLSHSYITVLALDTLHTRCGMDIMTDDDFAKIANNIPYLFKMSGDKMLITYNLYPGKNKTPVYTSDMNSIQYRSLSSYTLLLKYNDTMLTYLGESIKNGLLNPIKRVLQKPQISQMILFLNSI